MPRNPRKHNFNQFSDQEKDKLKQEKEEFESYKESEERKLREKLNLQELNYKTALEELKIKEMSKLKDDFLESIQNEYWC